MRKPLFVLFLMILGFFLPTNKSLAYGPFVLPIHDNSVEINGGAWNYSDSCTVTATHSGFDFDGEEGDNVYASSSGVVSDMNNDNCPNTCQSGGWGCFVDIKHDVDGDGTYDYTTKYAHLVQGSITVAIGNSVSSNTKIGLLGNTGNSCGAHLHFGIQDYGDCQTLAHSCWLDPYNLNDDNATCCDVPNGCPNEGASSQHPDFDCDAASDSHYLWASCPPTYDAEVSTCTTSAYDVTLAYITDAFVSSGTEAGISTYYQDDDNELDPYGEDAVVTETANPNYTIAWLSGQLTNDDETDLVQVTSTAGHTHAYVYRSAGSGGFYDLEEWKSTGTPADYAFLGDTDSDGLADLILGYTQSDDTVQWKTCTSNGSTFNSCSTWTTSDTTDTDTFGSDGDIFVVGNFDGTSGTDILRGRTQSTSSCNGKLKWKLLASNGSDTSVKDCWGYPSDQYLSGNADGTGGDDLVRIHTATTDPEDVFASVGVIASGSLSTSSWSDDVGGTTATYALGDVNNDGYDDILRWGSSNLQWLENNHTSFEQQGGADDLITDFPQSDDDAILYGTFGSVDVCVTIESTTTSTTSVSTTVNPYTSQVLTNLASADYADLSSSITCAVDEADSLYVVQNGQDGRIYEFESTNDGVTWTSTHLTSVAAVPLSAPGTTPHLFIDPDTGDRYVAFTGSNARINLFHYNGTSWTAVELTSVVAAPLADLTSSPFGYMANGIVYVVFQGDDQRIWRFSVTNGTTYGSLDLTGRASVEYAMPGTSPMGIYNEITGEHHIVFQGINQRIQRLTYNGSTWSSVEITSVINSDLLDTASNPYTYVDPFTGYVYTVINGVNERIDLIADYHTSLDSDELTSLISVPLTEPGTSPTGYIDPFTRNHVITFQGDNGRINQFEGPDMTAPVDWTGIDQTSQAAVEFAAPGTSPATCVDPFTGVRHTAFVGDNGRVQYLRYGP